MGKEKNNEKNKGVILWASDDREQFYDVVADNLLDCNVDRMIEVVDNDKDIIMIHETFVGANNKCYNGLDTVFQINGLVEIFNKYFVRKKIDLAAKKDLYEGYNSIRIYRFMRIKGGEDGVVLKTERETIRDDVEIIDSDSSKDKERITKKIEQDRKLINEG